MKFEIVKVNVSSETSRDRKDEPYRWSNKMYIWPEGESVLDNLFNRHNRPSKVWKDEIIPAILEKIKEQYPAEYEQLKNENWAWRQKCGCSCPCSPGFVGKNSIHMYSVSASVKFYE